MHDDRDGSIVRDASGVIVGAGRKKSEPKIVGFINIEPRKRPQQVIITEVSSPSKQGRASARKQREEKVQQQGRRRTLATRGAPRREIPSGRGRLRGTAAEMSEAKKRVRVDEAIELSDLAHQMGVKASRILRTLWQMGTRGVTINSSIDVEMAELVAAEFGYTVENVSFDEEDLVDLPEQGEGTLRAPVVTVMGHVDHGKTTLLDRIREANVAGGEAGGITQHVGAYRVDTNAGPIVFLDTPGHQAFIAMRERGAMLTDILVLVVAADDGVMPTTVEAIKLAKAENLPIVVALNKIDKPEANPARVKRELMNEGVVSEEFGGEVPIVEISAKTGLNLEKLLELLALQAEVLDLRASDEGRAVGTVIEARIEKGRGVIATVLIEHGTLRRGDVMVAGEQSGKVRAMLTDRGDAVDEVGPSTPVEIFGLDGVPGGGEKFAVVESEKDARQLVAHRREIRRRKESAKSGISALERMKRKKDHCLKIVLRADVAGSVEAVKNSIEELSNSRVRAEVISSGVGTINETDIKLAHAGEAIVIGFNTKPAGQTARLAESLDVQIHTFAIIYEAVDRVRELMLDLLPPEYREKPLGTAEVRALFPIPRLGMVCGCRVTRGLVNRSAHVRVRRGDKMIHEGRLSSLRVFKEDVKEVKEGFECGIVVEGFEGAQAGDVIEAFELEVIRPTM
jgi:translation initiation factor IF-2